ncbi:MAG: hypothetical protein VW882_06860, partial [Gammaproteobacteria bacterium]
MFDEVIAQLSAVVSQQDSQDNTELAHSLDELSRSAQTLSLNILCFEQTAIKTILECLVASDIALQITQRINLNSNTLLKVTSGNLVVNNESFITLESISNIPSLELLLVSSSKLNSLELLEYNQAHSHSIMGVIAAPANYSLSDIDLGAFNLFSDAVECLGFWLTPEMSNSSGNPWLQTPINATLKTLPAIRLAPAAQLPDYIQLADNSIRTYVIQSNLRLRLNQILQAINAKYQANEQQVMSGFTLAGFEFNEVKITKSPEKKAKYFQKKLEQFNSKLKSSVKHAKRLSKEKLIGRGLYFQLLEAELATIDKESIEEEKQHKNHQLSLKPHVFEVLQDTLWTQISDEIKQENKSFYQEFNQAVNELSDVDYLTDSIQSDITEEVKDNDHIHGLREHMDIKPRYSGERPVRGFFKRLGEGRKAVFMVLMSLSIFGTMAGFNYRDYAFVGFIFLLIFIFSFIYTFYSWRKEDEILLDKEVDKLRDQLHTDFQRAINEISRDNIKELEERVADARERVGKLNSDYAKQSGESQKESLERAKDQYADKQEILKNLLKEAQQRNELLAQVSNNFLT